MFSSALVIVGSEAVKRSGGNCGERNNSGSFHANQRIVQQIELPICVEVRGRVLVRGGQLPKLMTHL